MVSADWRTQTSSPSGRPAGRLLVLPGRGYTVDHPLLFETSALAVEAGWAVHAVRWEPAEADLDDATTYVERAADRLLADVPEAPVTVVLAKSLGTLAVGWANRHGFPGVWMTPLLVETPEVVRELMVDGPEGLLIGGSADPLWNADTAAASRGQVLEIPGANHALRIAGDWRASVRALDAVLTGVEGFLETAATR